MVHYFHSDIAQKYGINAAVLAAFIWECIEGKSIIKEKIKTVREDENQRKENRENEHIRRRSRTNR